MTEPTADQNRQLLTTLADLGIATHRLDQIRDAARLHRQQLIGTSELYAVIEADARAVPAGQAPATDQAALAKHVTRAIFALKSPAPPGSEHYRSGWDDGLDAAIDAAREAVDAPLSPFYEHPECGFHWHGRDGMDIPLRDGQPVCPRCELLRVEKLLSHRERRCEELRAESKRRGKIKLEQAEKIRHLENQLDEVRTQLGAEILRAGQAESELRRVAAEAGPADTGRDDGETDCCGAEPPDNVTWGDCWCTRPPGHTGEHQCQPCTDRHGAPGWTVEQPAAAQPPQEARP